MRCGLFIGVTLAATAASCTTAKPELQLRAQKSAPQPDSLAEAEGQLALGNVGLALEGFRRIYRVEPDNARAAAGIARSYESMGRFDLSRRWFETALASAPDDLRLLSLFARSLERQGSSVEAASVREEVARLEAAKVAEQPRDGQVTRRDVDAAVQVSELLTPERLTESAGRVVIALPPPTRGPITATTGSTRSLEANSNARKGPRLERLSLGEVALVTRKQPTWKGELVASSEKSATFRWVQIKPTARRLNAARRQGLAARTRARLVEKGWRHIEIGDAPSTRATTLVLYPAFRRGTAERLAKQFGFTQFQQFDGDEIIVLLGQDTASLKSTRAG